MAKRLRQLNQVAGTNITREDYLLVDGDEYLESKKIKLKNIDLNKFNTESFYNKNEANDKFITPDKIDQLFNPQSTQPQSGQAVHNALMNYLSLDTELVLELDGGNAGSKLDIEYTVDKQMSINSPNPVENRVVTQYINEYMNWNDQKVEMLEHETTTLAPIKNHRVFCSSYGSGESTSTIYRYYYVDNINGKDTNAGNSWSQCFKTLKKALDTANADGNHDVRIALAKSDDAYEFPYATMAVNALHMYGYVPKETGSGYEIYDGKCDYENDPPVTVKFTNPDRNMAWYASHINLQGLKIQKSEVTQGEEAKIYSDGGMVLFTKCKLDCWYQQNGGTLWFDGCCIKRLVCEDAIVKFYTNKSTITDDPINASYRLVFKNSQVSVQANGLKFYRSNDVSLMNIRDTVFNYGSTNVALELEGTSDKSDLITNNAIIWISTAYWQDFEILKNSIVDTLVVSGNARIRVGQIGTMDSYGVSSLDPTKE